MGLQVLIITAILDMVQLKKMESSPLTGERQLPLVLIPLNLVLFGLISLL